MPDPRDPIPRRVPLDAGPDQYDFEACTDQAPRRQARTYRIRMTGPGRIKLRRWRIRGDDEHFTLLDPGEVELTEGGSTSFSIVFQPDRAGTYRARLTFSILFFRPNGSSLWVTGRVALVGEAKACAAAAQDEEAGGGEAANDADPAPPGGEGEDDTPAAGEDAGATDTGTDPDGGGASPGTAPPAPGTSTVPETTVCVRFWRLPGMDPSVEEATLDRWLGTVNRIYYGSGVRFERAPRPFAGSAKPGAEQDPHCLDIYLGGLDLLPGDTAGIAAVDPRRDVPDILEPTGAHPDFRQHAGLGTSIQLETGAGRTPDTTLAHELGHALGLGPAPEAGPPPGEQPPEAAPRRQEHLDPTDGRPITDSGRLMHPAPEGTRLTERERRVARVMAQWVRGGPRYKGCEKTAVVIPDPRGGDAKAPLVAARLQSLPDRVEITLVGAMPVEIGPGSAVRVAVDLAGTGAADWEAVYAWKTDGWRLDIPPPSSATAPALGPPDGIRWQDGPAGLYGLAFDLPKAYLGRTAGPVGIAVSLEGRGAGQRFPAQGLQVLDLTTPQAVLTMNQDRLRVAGGGLLRLEGAAWQTDTFSGQLEVTLVLRRGTRRDVLPLGILSAPLPEHWTLDAELPPELPAGDYAATLLAECPVCGVSTSLRVDVRVIGENA